MPFQSPSLPFIDQAESQDQHKDKRREKTVSAYCAERGDPGVEENYFDIEDNKKNGHEIEMYGKWFSRFFKGNVAAFERFSLIFIGPAPGADKSAQNKRSSDKQAGNYKGKEYG